MTDNLTEELKNLPFDTQMQIPITPAIPYFFRWKIMQLKLMLKDLKELEEKHEILNAEVLYGWIRQETEHLMLKIAEHIKETQEKRGY